MKPGTVSSMRGAEYEQSSDYASQELRLASPSGEKVEYAMAGLYYSIKDRHAHAGVHRRRSRRHPGAFRTVGSRSISAPTSRPMGMQPFANADVPPLRRTTGRRRWAGATRMEQKDLNFQQFDPNGLGVRCRISVH